ncbi:o-spanin [Rhizobium phage Palo]|uniref:O-spanin n=1 Tax=Rhizobium phage Palo TaxID=2767573 RepID=A0A7L8G4I7_9CAUD|nr:o-spanin [Rhizobium phage Palo]
MRVLKVCLLALLVSSCVSVGSNVSQCGPNDKAIRLTDEQISSMSDQQVTDVLALNESLAKRGCAVPNKD